MLCGLRGLCAGACRDDSLFVQGVGAVSSDKNASDIRGDAVRTYISGVIKFKRPFQEAGLGVVPDCDKRAGHLKFLPV